VGGDDEARVRLANRSKSNDFFDRLNDGIFLIVTVETVDEVLVPLG
jgi:hypothetical protein